MSETTPMPVEGVRTSEESAEMYGALATAQAAIEGNPPTDKVGKVSGKAKGSGKRYSYEYKYTSLPALLLFLRPALAEAGLAVMQPYWTEGGQHYLATRIVHKSGQWMQVGPVQIGNSSMGPQDLGGQVTYHRRYHLNSIFAVCGEEDDDAARSQERHEGQRGNGGPPPERPQQQRRQRQQPAPVEQLTDEQLRRAIGSEAQIAGKRSKDDEDLQNLIWLRCLIMAQGNVPKARAILKKASTFEGEDGGEHGGWESVNSIPTEAKPGSKTSALKAVYGKVKEIFARWTEQQDSPEAWVTARAEKAGYDLGQVKDAIAWLLKESNFNDEMWAVAKQRWDDVTDVVDGETQEEEQPAA